MLDTDLQTALETMNDSLELFDNSGSCMEIKGGWLSTTDEKQMDSANTYPSSALDTSNTLDAISEILFACDVAENNTMPCTQGKHQPQPTKMNYFVIENMIGEELVR